MRPIYRVTGFLPLLLSVVGFSTSAAAAERIYWTDAVTRTIQRAELDGSGVTTLIATGTDPAGIALDLASGKIYWAEIGDGKIRRANLDGSGAQDIVVGITPVAVAIDAPAGKIYWTDFSVTGLIHRANLDGSAIEGLIPFGGDREGLALDLRARKMYWTERALGRVERANLDGQAGYETLVTGLADPRNIAVVSEAGKMYWADLGTHRIQRGNLDGSAVETLVTGLVSPSGIAVDAAGGKMYWTDFGTSRIQRANLDGSGLENVVTGLSFPVGIALEVEPAVVVSNDNFADATTIDALSFTDNRDLNGTTLEPFEPQFCNFQQQTVWYKLSRPTTTLVQVDLRGSDFGVVLNVYRSFGSGLNALGFIGCASLLVGGSTEFTANPGETYYIQAGSVVAGPAQMSLHVQQAAGPAGPANDSFASARLFDGVPFSDTVDMTAATTEPGEPLLPSGAFTPIAASAWYAFRPTTTGAFSVRADSCCVTPIVTVYAGSGLTDLREIASRSGFGQVVTFTAVAGTTSYIQLGRGNLFGGGASMFIRVDALPPPFPDFGFFPADPSAFDNIQFFDASYDPGQIGFQPPAWNFGDGTSSTTCCPIHRFSADGDYVVGLVVTTLDGRTASTSRVVAVRTHDVAITKFSAPTVAGALQTKRVSVGVNNRRGAVTVQVQLFKSVPGGFDNFQIVGTMTLVVPGVHANRTTAFDFNYAFTNDDAQVGKVTFKAVATIVGARDALPADNTAIASPTKVKR